MLKIKNASKLLGAEYEVKKQLEERKRAVDEKCRYQQRQIKELQEDIQVKSKKTLVIKESITLLFPFYCYLIKTIFLKNRQQENLFSFMKIN